MKVSQYAYDSVMDQLLYNPETKEWHLPGYCLKGFEEDKMLLFSSKYAAHEFIYNHLGKD